MASEAGSGRCGTVRAAVMEGDHLDILMPSTAVRELVFDAQIGEVDVSVEKGQFVVVRPRLDLPLVSIRPAVAVAVAVTLVQPLLVIALQLVVQGHALDRQIAFEEPLGDAEIRLEDLDVVLKFPLAFQTGVELLARVLAAIAFVIAIGFQQVASAVGEHDRNVAAAVDLDCTNQALLPEVPKVVSRVARPVAVVAEIAGGDDPECPNRGERTGLGAAQAIRALPRIEDPFPLRAARQMERLGEHLAGVLLAGIAAAVRPAFNLTTGCVH